jgi:uncharacterized membrane protein YkoI
MTYSMPSTYATAHMVEKSVMKFVLPLLVAAFGITAAAPADARPRREQDAAFRATQEGRFIPLRAIEARIVPAMRGFSYLGPELDAGSGRYRLKFLRGPQVVWVDVDARTGEVVGKSGF